MSEQQSEQLSESPAEVTDEAIERAATATTGPATPGFGCPADIYPPSNTRQ
jgi:hypothetical protein